MTALRSVAPNGMSRDVAKQTNIDLQSVRMHTHTHAHTQTGKIHKTLPHEASNFSPPSKWMSSHCNISHPCFFAQLNLLIHFACKPICLSSRSQTVPCPHCSLFSCTVYFSLSFALLSLNDEAISRAFAPWEIEGISVHTSIPPPLPPFLQSLPPVYLFLFRPPYFQTVLTSEKPGLKCALTRMDTNAYA